MRSTWYSGKDLNQSAKVEMSRITACLHVELNQSGNIIRQTALKFFLMCAMVLYLIVNSVYVILRHYRRLGGKIIKCGKHFFALTFSERKDNNMIL